MKTQKLLKTITCLACIALASTAALRAQTLIDFNIDPTGGNGQAVLGGTTDTYNSFASSAGGQPGFSEQNPAQTLVANALSSTGATTGVAISTTTGFNTYSTSGGTTANPSFLMDGYAYTGTGSSTATNGSLNLTFSGLTAYDGDTFTLEVYGAGNGAGNGDAITVGSTTLDTSGNDRDITNGVGDAYQTFTGTISGDTLSITGNPNPNTSSGGYTELNGAQLQLTAAAAPEPSTWALMVGGTAFLAFRLRRKLA